MTQDEFDTICRNLGMYLLGSVGAPALDMATGFLYAAFISQKFPEWWQAFATHPTIDELASENGANIEELIEEARDAYIAPKPQSEEPRVNTWRN